MDKVFHKRGKLRRVRNLIEYSIGTTYLELQFETELRRRSKCLHRRIRLSKIFNVK